MWIQTKSYAQKCLVSIFNYFTFERVFSGPDGFMTSYFAWRHHLTSWTTVPSFNLIAFMVVDILGSGSTPSHWSILSGKADKELVQASYDQKKSSINLPSILWWVYIRSTSFILRKRKLNYLIIEKPDISSIIIDTYQFFRFLMLT